MKKITLVIFMMVCAVGFSQQATVKDNRTDNPIKYDQNGTSRAVVKPNVSLLPGEADAKNQGENKPVVYMQEISPQTSQSRNAAKPEGVAYLGGNNPLFYERNIASPTFSYPLNEADIQAEVLADRLYRESNPRTFVSPAVGANRPMADIIPTAGATETFTPAEGDHFFDPGGPGGGNTDGEPGNYPNCNCDTQTTLMGVSEIDFQYFNVFGNFDYLRIYDGIDATGIKLYDNSSTGTQNGDRTLDDMIASNGSSTFTSASGNFFFFFHASSVVDRGGWDAEIITAGGGGGGGDTCSQDNPENGFENAFTSSKDGLQIIATDINVPADTDFTLETITVHVYTTPGATITSADITFYENSGNIPGAMTSTQAAVVPVSQTVIGTNFGLDVSEVVFDVTPELLEGLTGMANVYWVGVYLDISAGSGYIGGSTVIVGMEHSYSLDAGLTWNSNPGWDSVYVFDGICEPTSGGGGDTCMEENPNDFTFENGFNCSSATAFQTANDLTVAADEDFTLENITASIFANGGVANVDVNYYDDNAGLPGALIGSEASVTIDSQTVIGSNFGIDVNEVEMTVTPFVFVGQSGIPTKYWVELSVTDGTASGSVFWVVTSSSSQGSPAAQFDAGWSIADPLMDGVYIWEGTCEPTSGGGGDTCTEENPNDFTFENGFNCSSATAFQTANDLTVNADEDFTLENITASIFANGGVANVDVNYYDDNAGLPGALIGSEASVTIDSQTVIGSNFGIDVNEVEMTVTPFVFAGQSGIPTKYWVELSVTDGTASGSVFWVVTSSSSQGSPAAQFDAGWSIADPLMDGVYIWEGSCDPISGGDTCIEDNPNDGTFENGFNCSSATAFQTANDLNVAADEDFTLTNITASIFANGGVSNVDVNYYDDNAGLPGTLIGSEASVTIDSQAVIGSNFGIDVNEIELTVSPFLFAGQNGAPTKYWVELSVTDGTSSGSVFWVVTSSTSVGSPAAQYDAGWSIADPLMDGVYTWEGICEPTVGIVDNTLAGFNYYPNPTSSVLNFSADKNIESVSLYNLLGQEVVKVNVEATSSYLNLENLATGTYIMKVSVEGQIGTYKIIKN